MPRSRSSIRTLGLGLITGAADDDPSAIGTYAAAGARAGPALLWTVPLMLPMTFAVVYLSAKLGQVTGRGLFAVIRQHSSPVLLYATLAGVLVGNTFEAAADLGGMAAALRLLLPIRFEALVVAIAVLIVALQVLAPYETIRDVFKWLTPVLFAYVAAACLARPDLRHVIRGTLVPSLRFDRESMSILVAMIGTSLSAYLFTWQSNEEVEEKIAAGRQTAGVTNRELRRSRRDVLYGMVFGNAITYFIMLATASTLFANGGSRIESAADAARALEPVAGHAAGILFATGVIGVGFLSIPVMTAGAAYDVSQSFGWRNSLGARPREAMKFYGAIVVVTVIAVGVNFAGFNPMRLLVWSGVVQGFSTPPLMLLILTLTNDPRVVGDRRNGAGINILAGITTAVVFAASAALVVAWIR